jgi:cytoskeletal protein CcmA (bactofilin family)
VSYFSQKDEKNGKSTNGIAAEAKLDGGVISTVGPGMMITGNVVCTGAMQIFGRVNGDVHAARLTICKGAQVEGKIIAQEALLEGTFKGTIHGNSVKLQATAMVNGEIFNKSLSIEQNAQFEGVARRLDKAVEPPSLTKPQPSADVVPITRAADLGHGNPGERL